MEALDGNAGLVIVVTGKDETQNAAIRRNVRPERKGRNTARRRTGEQLGAIVDKKHNILAADWDALYRRQAYCNRSDVVAAKVQRSDRQTRCMLPAALVSLLRYDRGKCHAGGQCERENTHQPDGESRQ